MTGRGAAIALRNVLNVLFLIVSIPLTVGIYAQAWVEMNERAQFPPPGQLVDIGGGEKIHVRTWGDAAPAGRPTLLLFNGCCSVLSSWAWVARDLAPDYRLVAYDRPGTGWSTGGTGPRDADHAARAIADALRIEGIGPPYIVVAHSYGGFAGRVFTAQHRPDVAALILLDTSHPDAPGSGYGPLTRMNALKVHAGMGLLGPPETGLSALPQDESAAANAVVGWSSHLDGVADELDTWDLSADEVRAAGSFGDLPLLVVASGGKADQYNLDLMNLSTNSQLAELNVGHTAMLLERDQAAQLLVVLRAFLAGLGD